MIVRVEIRLLHELLRRLRRLREFLKLARCVEVVVPILALVVLPPLRGVPAMQAHVVEARDVWQIVLPDGEAELRLVDLHPGGAEAVQQREGLDRKSTRLNSSHLGISYAVFCLKKKKKKIKRYT